MAVSISIVNVDKENKLLPNIKNFNISILNDVQ
jgi:hypothetical protein